VIRDLSGDREQVGGMVGGWVGGMVTWFIGVGGVGGLVVGVGDVGGGGRHMGKRDKCDSKRKLRSQKLQLQRNKNFLKIRNNIR
jgi:hypothetical protein